MSREKVDLAQAKLPGDTEEPTVNEVKMSRFDPMLVLNLAGDVPERTLTKIAKDLKEKLEALSGVLEVNLVGTREELMEVVVDPLSMESYGLDQAQIINFVNRNNRLVAAGALHSSEGRFPVKVPGVFENAEDVLDMPIKAVGERVVHFKDIAQVRRTYKDAESVCPVEWQACNGYRGHPAITARTLSPQSTRSTRSSRKNAPIGRPGSRSSHRGTSQKM